MNKKYMDFAFELAEEAYSLNEVPVGAVIVKDDNIISFAYNTKESNKSVLDHAELIAIREAAKVLNNWRLDGCDLYVTLDPCPMCASAIKQSRIKNVYSALENLNKSDTDIINTIFVNDDINPKVNFFSNLDSERSKLLLNNFFTRRRNK